MPTLWRCSPLAKNVLKALLGFDPFYLMTKTGQELFVGQDKFVKNMEWNKL
jgi:hypothetical protein